MKTIYDYFTEEIDYPDNVCDDMLPYNTVLCSVSTTLLDGFVNYVKPLVCFVLDSYVGIDEQIEEDRAHVSYKKDRRKYFYFQGTKRELIEGINSGEIQITHTRFHMFGDDIVILSEIAEGKYMFFWYHMSGRCDIGRFKTGDNAEAVKGALVAWLNERKQNGAIDGFHKLNINDFMEGWTSF